MKMISSDLRMITIAVSPCRRDFKDADWRVVAGSLTSTRVVAGNVKVSSFLKELVGRAKAARFLSFCNGKCNFPFFLI